MRKSWRLKYRFIQYLLIRRLARKAGLLMVRKTTDKRLEKLYSEVFQSGDKYKQRAICEVMTSMQGKSSDPDVRMVLNRYEQQAKQDIEKVRTTPDIEKAEQEAQTDWQNYRGGQAGIDQDCPGHR